MPGEVHAARTAARAALRSVEEALAGFEDLQDVIDLLADRPVRDRVHPELEQRRFEAHHPGDLVELPGELRDGDGSRAGAHAAIPGSRRARA